MRHWIAGVTVAVALALPRVLAAEERVVSDELDAQVLAEAKTPTESWKTTVALGLSGSMAQSDQVPGTPDGTTWQAGVVFDATAAYTHGRLTWNNMVKVQQGETRTPLLNRFVKSADLLEGSTTAMWHLPTRWLGAYGRVRAGTALLPGYLIKPTGGQIKKQFISGAATVAPFAAEDVVPLTGAFEPLLLGEGVGLFAHATESEALTVKFKLGVGVQEMFARDGFTLADKSSTPEIELKQLHSATQAGAEAEATAEGKVDARLGWRAKAAVFAPAWTSISGTPTGWGAAQTDFAVGVSYKLGKWLSLGYQFTARRVPVVVDAWQITNGLVLGVSLLQ